jgi:hypothetical protein
MYSSIVAPGFVGIFGSWMSRRAGMEDARFFHQQANWCYQLAWQCFDLTIAHKLNAKGNQHIAKAHELSSQQRRGRETNKFADTRMDQGVAER